MGECIVRDYPCRERLDRDRLVQSTMSSRVVSDTGDPSLLQYAVLTAQVTRLCSLESEVVLSRTCPGLRQ